jgi:hypothetical protein
MANYRAYFVNSDGHIVSVRAIACGDDAEAIREAEKLRDERDIELWDGTRMVTRLPGTKAPQVSGT